MLSVANRVLWQANSEISMQEVYRGTLFELIPVEGREWKEAGLDREKLSCHTVPAKISANPTKMDFESA